MMIIKTMRKWKNYEKRKKNLRVEYDNFLKTRRKK